jgi:hypothetical protein
VKRQKSWSRQENLVATWMGRIEHRPEIRREIEKVRHYAETVLGLFVTELDAFAWLYRFHMDTDSVLAAMDHFRKHNFRKQRPTFDAVDLSLFRTAQEVKLEATWQQRRAA